MRDRLRVDDRALRAQLRDERRVERRHVHREIDVVVRRRAHVLRVERILERRDDAVHRQRREVGIAAVLRVELGGALERVGLLAEFLARGRRAGGQRPGRGMRVERALAGDRALAADVERLERVDWPGVGNADAHAHLRR